MSPNIPALSLSPKAQQWLGTTSQPRVLQVYSPVVNLSNEHGVILSIVVPEIGNGPFSLVAAARNFDRLVNAQSAVNIRPDSIQLGDLIITVEQAQLWQPMPLWEALISTDFSAPVQVIEGILAHEAPSDSVAFLIVRANHISQDLDRFQQAARVGVRLLTAGLLEDDDAKLTGGVEKLAGLGIGLTPAGDDFLVGVMHGLWATRDRAAAAPSCQTIIETALPRTNLLSAAWLQAAGDGEAGESWHRLLEGIHLSNRDLIREAVARILPTGHTSGADALAGFLHILKMKAGL